MASETAGERAGPAADITLYFARYSRSFTPLWLLEELGVPYRLQRLSLKRGDQKTPRYRRVNPMGKVPALVDRDTVVTENPAICLYLADRYGYGVLAPEIADARRGPYLRWMVFSTAVFEPAIYLAEPPDPVAAAGRGWGDRATVIDTLEAVLRDGPWLLGEQFTAVDVMLGSLMSIALFNRRIPDPPAGFPAYDARLRARPAYQRAAAITWPLAPRGAGP
ncbi:glutathione S-transferase family protein [Labrys wisconsinensis]|uniref:Glutathione S-transferase n=1 Tax=Labrys wisconsinensis TaxID=425677 RepID=A0ABU0JGK9_9HYPH|nr:glutathione S-transferase family protein [Labrys wisconsinensis]MDQ0472379.1 glutathione S-transferase [Labrys wisconsinensis]